MALSVFKISDLINKLDSLNNTQESIQRTSLWIIHHKAHCKDIVQQWNKSYCEASPKRQLILFYLANDVIQNSKKKGIAGYVEGFKEALSDACKETDDGEIFGPLNRVLQIWQDRCIFEREFINGLRESLYGDDIRTQLTSKIVSEFNPKDLYQLSAEVEKLSTQMKIKQQQFNNCKIDISNPDLNRLKDKNYGKHYQDDFDAATRCFKSLFEVKKTYAEKLAQQVEHLEKAKIYYSSKWKEFLSLSDKYQALEDGTTTVREYLLGRKQNTGLANFSPTKLNNLLASVTSGSSGRSLENRISNIFSGNTDIPSYDFWDNGYNPYQVTPNTSIDLENHQTTDMDIETSDDEAPNSSKKNKQALDAPYAIPPPPKQPKFQDFFPKTSAYAAEPQIPPPPLPPPSQQPNDTRAPFGHPIPSHLTVHTSERHDRNLIQIPPPPPPPPPPASYSPGSSYVRNHNLQSVVVSPGGHHSQPPPNYSHPYEHDRDHRHRSSDRSASRDKRPNYHHHHHHESDRNWKKRKSYNY